MPSNGEELYKGRYVRIDANRRTGTITGVSETCPAQYEVTLDGADKPMTYPEGDSRHGLPRAFSASELTVVGTAW